MGAELAVDVVEVVAQRMRGNLQHAGDAGGVAALGEQLQDPNLLVGERLDLRMAGRVAGDRHELAGGSQHPLKELRVATALGDITCQPQEEAAPYAASRRGSLE